MRPRTESFAMNTTEANRAARHLREHASSCPTPIEKRSVTYCFTPTGIGEAVTVRCACGTAWNVTDYGSW